LHLSLVAWLALCVACSYWQVGRAIQGNALSLLYAVEWPLFAVLGVIGWYALLHVDSVSEHQAKARAEYEEMMREKARVARAAENEDPSLQAYNDHLEKLSQEPKKKMFGH
jgi:DNA/RNA-binding domain of Phe-tRNA-synthetase-like protein